MLTHCIKATTVTTTTTSMAKFAWRIRRSVQGPYLEHVIKGDPQVGTKVGDSSKRALEAPAVVHCRSMHLVSPAVACPTPLFLPAWTEGHFASTLTPELCEHLNAEGSETQEDLKAQQRLLGASPDCQADALSRSLSCKSPQHTDK